MSTETDLDKARDEKCVPLAMGVLQDAATDMPVTDEAVPKDFQPLVTKIKMRALEADTNLLMENPYIFQLVSSHLQGLNAAVQAAVKAPLDRERYERVMKQILTIFSTVPIKAGKTSDEERLAAFDGVKQYLETLMEQEHITELESQWMMATLIQAFKATHEIFSTDIDMHSEKAMAMKMGIESMMDMTMKGLDAALKEPVGTRET